MKLLIRTLGFTLWALVLAAGLLRSFIGFGIVPWIQKLEKYSLPHQYFGGSLSLNGDSGHQSTIKFKDFKLLKSMKKKIQKSGYRGRLRDIPKAGVP